VAEPLVCIARVPAGLPFGAPDGRLTDLFALVVAMDDRQHLGLLARLAMMFNTGLPEQLRAVEDREDAFQLLLDTEAAFVAHG
jgi:mannitol/fructose-specific phosphotransferase system IIA component (Ntr-type)